MELHFPPLSGGTVSGLNDAGIETFEGDFAKNVVRECAQNSLDAAAHVDEQVRVKIEWVSLKPSDLPFLGELQAVVRACGDYWSNHDKAKRFFDTAFSAIDKGSIDAIKISDFGTTGVDGGDADKSGRWFGLVKSRGVSNQKGADSGGAFGIGKDAPLAGSACRTVIYSTRTCDGQVALQGVSRLVTHKNREGVETQGTGFIGLFDEPGEVYGAIRREQDIPERFVRSEPGLDVWILGVRGMGNNWAEPFVRSALANFWPAVSAQKIAFSIGGTVINNSTLGEAMQRDQADKQVGTAWPFYQATVNQHAKRFASTLPTAGKCRLHLLLGKRNLPKQVCMVRRTGMLIDVYRPRVGFMPFAGLFVCDSENGNSLLKSLEPPRHDKWDPERAEDPAAKRALKEIKEWIREVLKQQTPHAGEDQFNESEVPSDLLEDEPENPSGDGSEDTESDLGGVPKTPSPPKRVKIRRKTLKKEKGQGEHGVGGPDGEVEAPQEGDGLQTGGRKGRYGEAQGDSPVKPKVPTLTSRAFVPSDGDGSIELILRTDGPYEGAVWLEALGDDGATESLVLESAEIIGGDHVEVEHSKIESVQLDCGSPVRLRLQLRQPGKYAIRARLA